MLVAGQWVGRAKEWRESYSLFVKPGFAITLDDFQYFVLPFSFFFISSSAEFGLQLKRWLHVSNWSCKLIIHKQYHQWQSPSVAFRLLNLQSARETKIVKFFHSPSERTDKTLCAWNKWKQNQWLHGCAHKFGGQCLKLSTIAYSLLHQTTIIDSIILAHNCW